MDTARRLLVHLPNKPNHDDGAKTPPGGNPTAHGGVGNRPTRTGNRIYVGKADIQADRGGDSAPPRP